MEENNNYISLFNEHPDNNIFGNILPLSVITTDRYTLFKSKVLADGQILVGKTNDEVQIKGITGTNKQVIITHNPNDITFSTPQDLDLDSTPTFNNLKVDGLTGPYLVATDSSKNLQSLNTSSNNGMIVGITGSNLIIDTPQDIRTTSNPTFNNINVNNIDCTSILSTGDINSNTNVVGSQLVATGLTYNRLVGGTTGGALQSLNTTSNNGVIVGITGSNLTIDTPQDLQTTGSPTFSNLNISNNLTCGYIAGNLIPSANNTYNLGSTGFKWKDVYTTTLTTDSITIDGLSSNRLIGTNSSGTLQSLTATSNNGMIVGITGSTLTIDTPQNISVGSAPMFADINLPGGHSLSNYLSVLFGFVDQDVRFGASPTFFGLTVHGNTSSRNIYPTANKTYDIGSTSNRWRNLYLGNGNGTIDLGVASNGQASLNLNSDTSTTSHINFGTTGVNWHFSSRTSTENNEFRFYRGPALGGYNQIMTFTGSGANANRVTFDRSEDSTATTNGSVVFNGGVGIAKKLNVGSLAINGTDVNMSNLVTTNTSQTITAHKSFTGSAGSGTSTRNIQVGGQVSNCGIKFGGWVGSGVYYELGPEYDTHRMHLRAHNYDILTVRSDYNSSSTYKYVYANGHIHLSSPYGINFIGRGGSSLNYYEEHSYSSYFTGSGGTISTNISATVRCIRIGKNITVDVDASSTNFLVTGGNPALIINTPIQAQFRPTSSNRYSAITVNNNNTLYIQAMTHVNGSGDIFVVPAPNGYFVGGLGSSNHIRGFSLTYNIN